MKTLLLAFIRLYQLILSPILGNNCRFYPSCSQYAQEAIETHGIIKGSYLTIRRILKCHPWHAGGCDPVPPADSDSNANNKNEKDVVSKENIK